jgi:hypothetical protein
MLKFFKGGPQYFGYILSEKRRMEGFHPCQHKRATHGFSKLDIFF